MKSYQHGVEFTLIWYSTDITHNSKLASKSLHVSLYQPCIYMYVHLVNIFMVSVCMRCLCFGRWAEMCNRICAWSGVAPFQCGLALRIRINTHIYKHTHAHMDQGTYWWFPWETTTWLYNANRKRWVLLPNDFKGPSWDAHLLREIFYLDAIAAAAPQQRYQASRKHHI